MLSVEGPAGSVFSPPTLQAPNTGKAHVGEDQQPNRGGLHQSSVHCPVEDGGEPVVVGPRELVFSECSSALENRGDNLMSRGSPQPEKWFWKAEVDLFSSQRNNHYPL